MRDTPGNRLIYVGTFALPLHKSGLSSTETDFPGWFNLTEKLYKLNETPTNIIAWRPDPDLHAVTVVISLCSQCKYNMQVLCLH